MRLTSFSLVQCVAIAQIRLDGGTQTRVALNEAYISELAQAVAEGATLHPAIL